MRRSVALALCLLFVGQSSGIAVAGNGAETSAPSFPAQVLASIGGLRLALASTYIGALLTGSQERWAAMHAPPPHFSHTIPHPDHPADARDMRNERRVFHVGTFVQATLHGQYVLPRNAPRDPLAMRRMSRAQQFGTQRTPMSIHTMSVPGSAFSFQTDTTTAPQTLFDPGGGSESGAVSQLMNATATGALTDETLTYAANAGLLSWGWISPANSPNTTAWPAQTYTVSLKITQPNTNLNITEVKIYRVDAGGGPSRLGLAVVGDLAGLSQTLGTTGTLTFNVVGSAQTASASDRLAVKFYTSNTTSSSQAFSYSAGVGGVSGVTVAPPVPFTYEADTAAGPTSLFSATTHRTGAISQVLNPTASGSLTNEALTFDGSFTGTFGWISAAVSPDLTAWPAQTYTITLNVTQPNANLKVIEVKIYRVDSNGGPSTSGLATVGDVTGLSQTLGAGKITFNVPGAGQTASATDRLGIKFFTENTATTSQTFSYGAGVGGGSGVTATTATPPPPFTYDADTATGPTLLFSATTQRTGAISQLLNPMASGSLSDEALSFDGSTVGLTFGWISAANSPGSTSWPAQNYAVHLNVMQPNGNLKITEVKLYRVDSNGGPSTSGLATVGDLTGLSQQLSPVGLLTFNVPGTAQIANATDRIGVKFYTSNAATTTQTFAYGAGQGGQSGLSVSAIVPTPSPTPGATPTPAPTSTPLPPSTTGVNRWWTYQEDTLPGIGKYMVNVGNGNLLAQATDVDIPERGIDLAFQRTYNSQSQHDYANTDGSVPSNYGNGWTNTFDAHIAYNAAGAIMSVYDIDGARYDYTANNGVWSPPAGMQGTALTYDGGCGYYWTKKTGTVYHFYSPRGDVCESPSTDGYRGRLYMILGRNQNNWVRFDYAWDNGDASTAAHLSQINAVHADGHTLALKFADVSGYRELSSITRPDRQTINYYYDTAGDLAQVDRPGNNASSVLVESYGTQSATHQLLNVSSPRYNLYYNNGSPTDGNVVYFTYDSSNRLTESYDWGVANVQPGSGPFPSDGVNLPVQSGYPSNTPFTWRTNQYSGWGSGTTNFTDSDGRATDWSHDTSARVTQTQDWSGTQWLATTNGWDSANNVILVTDARGNETDYAYDSNGNTIESALPSVTTSAGTFRPTSRYSYDVHNNVTAFCDAVFDHGVGYDWNATGPPAPSDSLCPLQVGTTQYTWTVTAYDPFGELTQTLTPSGYHSVLTYNAGSQGGTDDGLPTSVVGDAFTELDGTNLQPTQSFTYDSRGNVQGYNKGNGAWLLTYDTLNREISAADPDGVSTRTCYFEDGEIQASQSAAQYALDGNAVCGPHSTSYASDADGDRVTETHHFGNVSGTTTKWYDAGDRLVEVAEPHDQNDYVPYSWLTRYAYDISQGAQLTVGGSQAFRAYGNLYKTQQWLALQNGGIPAWQDLKGNSYDALDRVTAKYTYIPKLSVIQKWSSVYDSSSQTIGLLSETIDPLNASTNYSYDADAKVASMQFAGDGGVTPAQNYTYDPDGRPATATSAVFGTQTNTYDSDGRTTAVEEPRNGGVTLPATISYAYYPDGARKTLSVSTTSQTLTNLLSYSYRADGLEQTENFDYSGTADTFLFTFTSAGRITNQTDLHGADSWSYDTYGRLAGHSIPAGSYSAYSYDPEGQVTARTGYNGVNETLAYNVRGELTQDLFSNDTYNGCATGSPRPDNPMFEGVDQEGGDGVMHPFQYMLHPCGSGSSTTTDAGALWDARTGVITDGGSGDVTYGYDVAGRQINSASAWSYSNKCGDQTCSNSGTGKFNQTYDAQNHLAGQVYGSWNFISQNITGCMVAPGPMQQKYIGDQTVGYDWGPNGHPIRIGASPFALDVLSTNPSPAPQSQISYDTVHWDGDSLLFTSNSSGTIDDIKIGTIAEYVPGAPNGVTVLDRDQSGLVVSTHNNAGVGAWTPGSPYRQNCSGNATPTVQQTLAADQQAGEGPISEPATDGIFDGFNVIQGVRAMNNATGQWTTPDAYTGDIRDPMSERAYLWNRNNPVTYRDPTGYCAECWIIPFEIALRPIPLADDGRHGVPEKAFRIANFVEKHAVPPAGYEGGGKFENRNGELPAGGQYKEYDVNASVAGKARKGRGTERLVRDSKTGAWYYTDSHYDQKPFGENFTKLNPLWLTPSSVYSPSGVEPSPESARAY